MNNLFFNDIFILFENMRDSALLVLPVAFLIRLIINLLFFGGKHSHIELLKDTLICIGLLYFFVDIAQFLLNLSQFNTSYKEIELTISQGGWKIKILNSIGQIFYWVFILFFKLILILIILCSSYLILFASMTQSYGLLKIIFSALLFLGLWPLICSSIDLAIYKFLESDKNSEAKSYAVIGLAYFLKLLSPIFTMALAFKVPSFGGGLLRQAFSFTQKTITYPSKKALHIGQNLNFKNNNQIRHSFSSFKNQRLTKNLSSKNSTKKSFQFKQNSIENIKNHESIKSLKNSDHKNEKQIKAHYNKQALTNQTIQTFENKNLENKQNINSKSFNTKKIIRKENFKLPASEQRKKTINKTKSSKRNISSKYTQRSCDFTN